MTLSDRTLIVVCLVLCACFLSAAGIEWHKSSSHRSGTVLQVSASDVIGDEPEFRGIQSSQYTLVEFGDYECPPCRASVVPLRKALNHNARKLKFEFRNFPLTLIHRHAYDAAVLAEVARHDGKFWAVHDALYNSALDPGSLKQLAKEFQLGSEKDRSSAFAQAKQTVDKDMKDGTSIGINGTPALILCCPNGDVVRLPGLRYLSAALNE